jgi:hypothetical protein
MTLPTSVIALFCENIREEKSGQISLIGIFGDNINVGPPPNVVENTVGLIPRLHAYVRISFDSSSAPPAPFVINLRLPDGNVVATVNIEKTTVDEALGTWNQGNPVSSVFSNIQMGGAIPGLPGRIAIEVTISDTVYIAGTLNLQFEQPVTSVATASAPPS